MSILDGHFFMCPSHHRMAQLYRLVLCMVPLLLPFFLKALIFINKKTWVILHSKRQMSLYTGGTYVTLLSPALSILFVYLSTENSVRAAQGINNFWSKMLAMPHSNTFFIKISYQMSFVIFFTFTNAMPSRNKKNCW